MSERLRLRPDVQALDLVRQGCAAALPKVPALAGKHVGNLLADMLNRHPLKRTELTGWILHAGGREVLAAVQNHLGFNEADLRRSANVLRDFGNVSSPFVRFVLERALAQNAPGGWWWLSSFGGGSVVTGRS